MGGGNIKECLKRRRIEILNSDLFCVILFTLVFKEASQRFESFRIFFYLFFVYTMFHQIRSLWVVVVYDLLMWRSVLKMFARFIFRMEQGGARKMISSKCLQVISRQSNFERLERCLKKNLKEKTTKTNFKAVDIALRCEWARWKRRFEETSSKLFTSVKTGKCLKLNNSYLLLEACYEASLPIFFLFIELDK